jgi:hypothetical protein
VRLSLIWSLLAMMAWSLLPAKGHGQDTELEDCLGPGSQSCYDSPPVVVEDSCGTAFFRHVGRVSWPPLRNVGRVTISVQTRIAEPLLTIFPLFFEINGLERFSDSTSCRTGVAGVLVMEVLAGASCGGTWSTLGPIDLQDFGVHLGEVYLVQCVFFENPPTPSPFRGHSPGLSCIRVRSEGTATAASTWTTAKRLFR